MSWTTYVPFPCSGNSPEAISKPSRRNSVEVKGDNLAWISSSQELISLICVDNLVGVIQMVLTHCQWQYLPRWWCLIVEAKGVSDVRCRELCKLYADCSTLIVLSVLTSDRNNWTGDIPGWFRLISMNKRIWCLRYFGSTHDCCVEKMLLVKVDRGFL